MTRDDRPQNGAPVLEEAFFDTAPENDARAVESRAKSIQRALRRAFPIVGAVLGGLVLVGVLYAGPWPASHADTPELIAAARSSGAALGRELGGAAPGPLKAAVGTFDITPNPPFFVRLAGYPPAVRRSNNIDGKLLAWSWVVQAGNGPACALMGADLLLVTPALAHAVATEVDALAGIPRDRIVFTATHTHSALGGYGRTLVESWAIGANEEAIDQLSMRWAPTVWGITRQVRPAILRAGQPTAPGLITNRLDGAGAVDPTVDVLQLDVDAEEPAVLVMFGAHPTTETRMEHMTADYPGFMRKTVSEHVGAFVSFAAGAAGSMGARSLVGNRTPENVGKQLATPVMSAVRPRAKTQQVQSMDARVACGRAELPLPVPRIPVGGSLALTERASARLLEAPDRVHASALLVGPALVVSLPGELSGEVTPPLRALARKKGYSLAIASFNGEYAGYLLPAERFGRRPEDVTQLSGIGASAPAVAFIESLIDALPQGPLPSSESLDQVWPR